MRDNTVWESPRVGEERVAAPEHVMDGPTVDANGADDMFMDELMPIMGDWVAYSNATDQVPPASSVGGPFKASSPYYKNPQGPAGFGEHAGSYLTGAPADFMVKSPQDEFYAKYGGGVNMPSLFDMNQDDNLFLVQPGSLEDSSVYPDFPEPMEDDDDDEDDDEDDNDFDAMVISDDDDLYAPSSNGASPSANVPSTVRRDSQPAARADSVVSPIASEGPSSYHPHQQQQQHSDYIHDHTNSVEQASSSSWGSGGKGGARGRRQTSVGASSAASNAGRPHRCEALMPDGRMCGKYFSRPYDLVRHHETIHSSARKTFTCELCGSASRTFSRMDALSRHMRVKHSAGPAVSLKA